MRRLPSIAINHDPDCHTKDEPKVMEMVVPSSPTVDAARDLKYCPSEPHQLAMPQAAPRSVKFAPRPKPRSGDESDIFGCPIKGERSIKALDCYMTMTGQ